MAADEEGAFDTARRPEEYSSWASMMTRAESEGEAVEGATPRSWRKDLASAIMMVVDVETEAGNSGASLDRYAGDCTG